MLSAATVLKSLQANFFSFPTAQASGKPSGHADGRRPPRGGSRPSFVFQSSLQETNHRGGHLSRHPFTSPSGKTTAHQPVFLFQREQSPSDPSQPFPRPSSPGRGADRAGAATRKLDLPSFWQLHSGGKKTQTFEMKMSVLFFQATSADKQETMMYCVSPYKLRPAKAFRPVQAQDHCHWMCWHYLFTKSRTITSTTLPHTSSQETSD